MNITKIKISVITTFILSVLINISACNGDNKSRLAPLKKCSTLAEESIVYARANYVKLFHHFNPKKFESTYQKVQDFDHITHRNTINTYRVAVRKIKVKDTVTESLINSCSELATFSTQFVDQNYPRAIVHKSEFDSLTNNFFIEVNQIVKFDHNIGVFDKNTQSFKHLVKNYEIAHRKYIKNFSTELKEERE